jgi:CheY-like chemotaxis protein
MSEARRILVVEDDTDIREALLEILVHHGYAAVGAEHGRDALDKLESNAERPAVILLDLMMPVMDGPTFRREQLRRPDLAAIPVVVISAQASLADAEGMNASARLRKPLQMAELLRVVREQCAAPGP